MTNLKGRVIGFGLTGSHCTYHEVFPVMQELVDMGAVVVPVLSYTVQKTDTRFGEAADHLKKIEEITGEKPIMTIPDAEPLGPKRPLDCMVIAPLTGNSTSKLANALTDSPVLMAAKATLRNESPVVLAVSTNDALGLNGINVMRLMATKNIYFVPLGQDHPYKKPNSLVADMTKIPQTIEAALEGKQLQPVLIERYPN
ncbi:dipicolinate synthase subunit B [Halobacillus litoralis]|uniref:Dipicolinate synthase subunit B n=1 Tax=Halobacillus litoralis TaxID=45668 RepID=A0A845DNQ4_9BACI|nr:MULTISPECIES: dipicolinate synthase subunit B [Halobacillus]MYL19241.1 dipicolinate synthase subunit B [Halobacillus litoralis]MYL28387.1 dipicolinate synthase subunit B [Halobacillus halophilus]MYL37681.1 dipicolinate synthase subunit B [Halobacillus litoralis]